MCWTCWSCLYLVMNQGLGTRFEPEGGNVELCRENLVKTGIHHYLLSVSPFTFCTAPAKFNCKKTCLLVHCPPFFKTEIWFGVEKSFKPLSAWFHWSWLNYSSVVGVEPNHVSIDNAVMQHATNSHHHSHVFQLRWWIDRIVGQNGIGSFWQHIFADRISLIFDGRRLLLHWCVRGEDENRFWKRFQCPFALPIDTIVFGHRFIFSNWHLCAARSVSHHTV